MTWFATFSIALAGAVVAGLAACLVKAWVRSREWEPEEEGEDY